jgi:hypothetical protein
LSRKALSDLLASKTRKCEYSPSQNHVESLWVTF